MDTPCNLRTWSVDRHCATRLLRRPGDPRLGAAASRSSTFRMCAPYQTILITHCCALPKINLSLPKRGWRGFAIRTGGAGPGWGRDGSCRDRGIDAIIPSDLRAGAEHRRVEIRRMVWEGRLNGASSGLPPLRCWWLRRTVCRAAGRSSAGNSRIFTKTLTIWAYWWIHHTRPGGASR